MANENLLKKDPKPINIVLVSKDQENNLDQMQNIMKESLRLLGCPTCTSGKQLMFRNFEEVTSVFQQGDISNILVAGSEGNVNNFHEVIKKGVDTIK